MKKLSLYVFAILFGISAAHASVRGNEESPEQANAGGGAKVNNPEWFGVTVLEALPPDCTDCTLIVESLTIRVFQDTATGDLYQCPFGPVLVTGE